MWKPTFLRRFEKSVAVVAVAFRAINLTIERVGKRRQLGLMFPGVAKEPKDREVGVSTSRWRR